MQKVMVYYELTEDGENVFAPKNIVPYPVGTASVLGIPQKLVDFLNGKAIETMKITYQNGHQALIQKTNYGLD